MIKPLISDRENQEVGVDRGKDVAGGRKAEQVSSTKPVSCSGGNSVCFVLGGDV